MQTSRQRCGGVAVRPAAAARWCECEEMIDHITLQVTSVPASTAFYEVLLAPLGIAPGHEDGAAVGFFGPEPGSFWLCPAQGAQDRELHIAFRAASRDAVRAFHQAAVAIGAEVQVQLARGRLGAEVRRRDIPKD